MNGFTHQTRAAATLAALVAAVTFSGNVSAGDGKNRRVRLINETRSTMLTFHASRIGADNWQEDILGDGVLAPGKMITVNFDDGTGACLFDFRAKFDDGDVVTRHRVDVCQIAQYRYTEE